MQVTGVMHERSITSGQKTGHACVIVSGDDYCDTSTSRTHVTYACDREYLSWQGVVFQR